MERLDDLDGRRVRVQTLNSCCTLEGVGEVVRIPDGDDARAQAMHGAAVQMPIILGDPFFLLFDGSMRRSSAVQAIVIES